MAYGAVDRRIWNDERFRRWDEDVRTVWLYLLTCPHGNRLGCFVLPAYYVADDVQMDLDSARDALATLEEEGRIVWDRELRVVCIRNHLNPEYNPLANGSVVKAATKDLAELPDSEKCLRALLEAAERWSRPHYEELIQRLRHRVGQGGGHGAGEGAGHGAGHGGGAGVPHPDPDPDPEHTQGAREAEDESDEEGWADRLWPIYLDELGGNGRQPSLTEKRRKKLGLLGEEQLSGEDDPEETFREILRTVQASDHHMSQRSYQMPESLFRNEDRRERWTLQALDGGPPEERPDGREELAALREAVDE